VPTPPPDIRQTPAYLEGVRVLRTALHDDNSPDIGADDADDLTPLSAPDITSAEPHLAFMAAPAPDAPTAPKSVAAARQLPDFDKPNGWRAAIDKEIRRVEGFGAWEVVPASQVREDQARYGKDRVSVGYIVAVLKCKLDTDGAAREPEVVNKFRVAVSDKDNVAAAETVIVTVPTP
jgi:hypothetical protein